MDVWQRLDAQDKAIADLKVQVNRVAPVTLPPDPKLLAEINAVRLKVSELSSKAIKDELPSTRLRELIHRQVFEAIKANGGIRKPKRTKAMGDTYRDDLIALIVRSVEKKWHSGIINGCRKQSTATARHVAAYLIREMTPLSFPEIGAILGRDHSSIIHAKANITKRMAGNEEFARTIIKLREQIEKQLPEK